MRLKITGAAKAFRNKKVLVDVNLSINTGQIIGLFGRNGSGKSTLLKMIFGVLKPDTLQLQIDDKHISPHEIIPNQLIAYLPQERFLPPRVTVRNLIPMYHQDPATLDSIFYAPGVAGFEQLPCGKLSIGQMKYLEMLLISHCEHPFLLLDEPFSMMDPKYKDLIKELLLNLKQAKGMLLTDHYYNDVLQISDLNYLLQEGKASPVAGEEELQKHGYLSGGNRGKTS